MGKFITFLGLILGPRADRDRHGLMAIHRGRAGGATALALAAEFHHRAGRLH